MELSAVAGPRLGGQSTGRPSILLGSNPPALESLPLVSTAL